MRTTSRRELIVARICSESGGRPIGDHAPRDRAVVAQPRPQRREEPLPDRPRDGAGEEAEDEGRGAEPGEGEGDRDRDSDEVARDLRPYASREAHVAQQQPVVDVPETREAAG